jgi:hypothetical protein
MYGVEMLHFRTISGQRRAGAFFYGRVCHLCSLRECWGKFFSIFRLFQEHFLSESTFGSRDSQLSIMALLKCYPQQFFTSTIVMMMAFVTDLTQAINLSKYTHHPHMCGGDMAGGMIPNTCGNYQVSPMNILIRMNSTRLLHISMHYGVMTINS